jgi:CubicO group peptidase (beta-lactamase class C family)
LQTEISKHSFPGASIAVMHRHELMLAEGSGHFIFEDKSAATAPQTVFDLASLTKVLATTTAAMLLYEQGRIRLEQPVADVVPEFGQGSDARKKEVTFGMLLAHSSGLPTHVKFYEQVKTREDLLNAAYRVPLEAEPMSRAVYSDIGFIILGVALERIANESIDVFCAREIFQPLGMNQTFFRPAQALRSSIPPTLDAVDFRNRVIQGEVNDENASVMGGVAGHAGLFGSALDVARFAECMLRGGSPILNRATIELFTARQQHPAGTSRTLGWDTPSAPSQSGQFFSPQSFGHLGYTGTSLWIDPERQLSVTLLTNRTWPDGKSQRIKQIRPAVHDAIVEALG